MGLPHVLLPSDVARSADVNDNFNYLAGVVGTSSTSSRADIPGDILIGPRNNAVISSKHDNDALVNSRKFMHIGMNLEYYDAGGGNWKYRRLVSNQVGMSYHFSTTAFELWATDAKSNSDPNPTMAKRWGVSTNYMYMPELYHMWTSDGDPGTNQGYRTTQQIMNTPAMIYNGVAVSPNKIHKTATNYGVSTQATAILISGRIYANSGLAKMKFYRDDASPNDINGFEINTPGGGSSTSSAGQGVVPLGSGSNLHRFVIEIIGNVSYAKVGIIGYYC